MVCFLTNRCSVRFFIHMAKTYKGRGQEHTNAVQGHAKDNVWGNPDFKAAFDNFRTLLERFANNNSMQRVFDSTE